MTESENPSHNMRGISTTMGESAIRSTVPNFVKSMTTSNMNLMNPAADESTGKSEILITTHALVGGSNQKSTVVPHNQYEPLIRHSHPPIIERLESFHQTSSQQEIMKDSKTSQAAHHHPRSSGASSGLDLLIALAEKERISAEVVSTSASSSEDEESMPPPPPRRRRSNSSPANMLSPSSARMIVPEGFLEAELAELRRARRSPPSIPEHKEWKEEDYNSETILCDARSRLLEELAGKTGVLPHELSKYKDMYNQNGCIGIYTPQERAAILARFQDKRTRRNWNKRVRYNCRKNLADSRVRVKGRFVKREEAVQIKAEGDMPDTSDPEAGFAPTADLPYRRLRRHTLT